MALYQTHGVNPVAGCLPIIVQMPIIIGLYHAIMRTGEIKNHTFFWFDFGSPDIILSILAGVLHIFPAKDDDGWNDESKSADGNDALAYADYDYRLWNQLPAALSLYWVVGSIFMILQTFIINGTNKSKDPSAT